MSVPYEVLGVYCAIAIWVVLLLRALKVNVFRGFLGWGIALLLYLNVRYLVLGSASGISNFVAVFDVFDNIGLGREEGAPALATCPDNACSAWGDRYVNHPSWGVAFYDRFANGPASRNNMLYAHIFFNSVAFVLMHVQLLRPGIGAKKVWHRRIGRLSFASVTVGTVFALLLASEHGSVSEYGGELSKWGFYSMSAFVYGTAVMGVVRARRGDLAGHRVWMIRWAGAMWGAFWLFRVMLVFTGPLLRNFESASLLLSIWGSAPLGILIAEYFRRRGASAVSARSLTDSPAGEVIPA